MADMTQFDNIYFNQSAKSGRLRFANSGLGWKCASKSVTLPPFLLPQSEVISANWSRAAKGYECRVLTKDRGVVQFDGFDVDDFEKLKNTVKHHFDVVLESKQHSIRGWNWGKAEFERSEMVFQVSNRPAFEIPYAQVTNSNLVGKSEVALELNNDQEISVRGPSAVLDELVEMRFYIPGTVVKGEDEEDEDDGGDQSDVEDLNAAMAFYETIKDRADIGQVAGDSIVSFSDIRFLTPRGRYAIDMYASYLRLSGKTYDYKIQYDNIQKLFLLPMPDDMHNVFVIQLVSPLRQGQTRYPFLVVQFLREEELEVELNLSNEEFQEKYADKLKKSYDQAAHEVFGQILRGLSGRKITVPGSFTSMHGQAAVKCSLKANEGHLYLLDKSFLFIPKPSLLMLFADISFVTLSRVSSGISSSRTFDITVTMKAGQSHQFSNINREEQQTIEDFIKFRNLEMKNDLVEEQTYLESVMGADSDSDEAGARGSASDDEESVDEDFKADSDDSDVAEEYDENAAFSGSDEDSAGNVEDDVDEDEDEDEDDGDAEEEDVKPLKKKAKRT
ncbi:uncharacterized protein V1516DRAFT_676179 [Lipomyces oligophaga]|uniref:uncharacterized protein n=1 Tax=Lipomyces oligophaga TaxID=45792 RepID=UPI0034CF8EB6